MTTAPERIGLVENFGNYALWNSIDFALQRPVAQYIRADLAAQEYDRALEDAAVKAQHVLADVRCAKCNAPRNNHPYRHPFQPSESVDVPAAIRAMKKGTTDEA
jgi:hypothetical protein